MKKFSEKMQSQTWQDLNPRYAERELALFPPRYQLRPSCQATVNNKSSHINRRKSNYELGHDI